MQHKLIIDADPGIGDALAIALAMVDPAFDVLAVTGTAGEVSGEEATQNIQGIIALLDEAKWPRIGCGTGDPVEIPDAGGCHPVDLNGPGGLGDFASPDVELHHPLDADKLLIDLASTHPGEITLLTLGPLSNVQLACERHPGFLNQLRGLVCLGGSVYAGGDITPAAEFNVYASPETARSVLTSPATKTLIPLDTSTAVTLTFSQYDRLGMNSANRFGLLMEQLLPFAFRAHHQHLGVEGVGLDAVAALASIARPRLFHRETMSMDVETGGRLTRGMTVFDRRGTPKWQANIDVLTEVDAQGVLDYFSEIVRTAIK